MEKEKTIAEEMRELKEKNRSDLKITITVTKEGKLGMQAEPSVSDNEFRSVLMEAIVATVINNAVNATKAAMQADAISVMNRMGGMKKQ